jgi:hypothetical protein
MSVSEERFDSPWTMYWRQEMGYVGSKGVDDGDGFLARLHPDVHVDTEDLQVACHELHLLDEHGVARHWADLLRIPIGERVGSRA